MYKKYWLFLRKYDTIYSISIIFKERLRIILSELKKFFKPYTKQTVIGSAAKMAEAFLELLLPTYMGKIIDIGITNGDVPYIVRTAALMLGIIALGLISASICQYTASMACQSLANDIRKAIMSKIGKMSYTELDRFGNATLINRMTNDTNQVMMAFAMFIRLVSRCPFLGIGAILMAAHLAPKLAWLFIVLIPCFVAVMYIIMKGTVPRYKDSQSRLDVLGRILRENLSGVRVIRAFARHHGEKERIDTAADELSRSYIRVANLSALLNPLTLLIMNAGIILLLYLGGINVNRGDMSQGDIVVLINYITQVLYALITIANLVVTYTKAFASANRIEEVLACPISMQNGEKPAQVADEIIKFDRVSFAYNSEESLSDISFVVKKGETMGIVGATGSGKSTVINLMMRFYDAQKGAVIFGGEDVKALDEKSLRSMFGLVPQQATLFSGSIAENIRWGKPDATDDEVIAALKTAQAYDFVSGFERGIHHPIEEGGKNFSGGQRQRLTIARALVSKPPVVILDDSLSALDYLTDLKLREALKNELTDTTVIIISQRISSVMGADKILVLDDGVQAGLGKHEQLMENCGVYRELYRTQAEGGATL